MKKLFYLIFCFMSIGLYANEAIDITKLDQYMSIKEVNTTGIKWYKPDQSPFRLQGFKWYKQDQIYRRLPLTSAHGIPPKVNILANHTSGGQVHFKTNSKRILVRVKLAAGKPGQHMTQMGRAGFDLYTGEPTKQVFRGSTRFPFDAKNYIASLTYNAARKMLNCTLNFPLYNGVESIEIGLDESAKIEAPIELSDSKPIVIYGTSITQGGCATRPGMNFPNILSRRLNQEVVNLGFSGSGKGEPAMAHIISEIPNKKLTILDMECNTHESLRKVLEPFITILLKKNPNTPLLIVSRIDLQRDQIPSALAKRQALAQFQKDLVANFVKKGHAQVYFVDGSILLKPEWAHEATVDGTHPTDLGFLMMAEGLLPHIKSILNEK